MTACLLVPSKKGTSRAISEGDHLEYVDEALISEVPGVASARNDLAYRCKGPIMVYMDDDYNPGIDTWIYLLSVFPGTVIMTQGRNHPISRAMSLHKKTFYQLGGFDPRLKNNAEDLDFYLKCKAQNIPVILIPNEAQAHQDHARPFNPRSEYEGALVRHKFKAFTLGYFIQKDPRKAAIRALAWIYFKINGVKNE